MAFRYKGQDLPSYVSIQNIELSLLSLVEVQREQIPGRAGSLDFGNEIDEKEIAVEYTIVGDSVADLRGKARSFATFLYSEKAEELVLLEEPDKRYYAKLSGSTSYKEEGTVAQGSFTFLLTDPHLYGQTQTVPLVNGSNTITIGGNTVAYPMVDLTFNAPSTDLALVRGEDIFYLGQPSPVDGGTPTPVRNTLIAETCDTLSESWTNGTSVGVDGGVVSGEFTASGGQFKVTKMGTESGWHGPAIVHDLGAGKEVQDFTAEMYLTLKASHVNQITRVELILLDVNRKRIGKVALSDLNASTSSPVLEARIDNPDLTPKASKTLTYTDVSKGAYANFYGRILIQRIGNTWYTEIGKRDVTKNTFYGRYSKSFIDAKNQFSTKVAAIMVHIGQYGTHPMVAQTGIESIFFHEENYIDPATQIKNIVESGDTVTIDSANGMIYKNGEPAFDILDPNSRFLELQPGENMVEVYPPIVSSGTLQVTERWL